MNLEEIKQKLLDRNFSFIARATGIHQSTISAIMTGRIKNPKYETVKKLEDYLAQS